ncbi:uridylate kinase [Methanogenium marinum]|uniref:Uridylate kinase n=1 Tax=Methanogenium marinum TaxID=348610 RepID=A0A9Q4PWD2_9EURY|nr:uridylate kinase [Methanogenium marinum]MDE4908514.1 uridylate kinase [Methanogenium marinum]
MMMVYQSTEMDTGAEKRNGPLVVKVGGSLTAEIPELYEILVSSGRDILIVPGGGRFADAVRDAGAEGTPAHWMAVCAMEQTAWLLVAAGAVPVEGVHDPVEGVSVLLPYRAMREADPLPHSWDVTSDTIAAWVASARDAPLLLLKSVDGILCEGELCEFVSGEMGPGTIETDVVDPLFLPFAHASGVRWAIINGREPERLRLFLQGEKPLGTYSNPHL